MQLLRETLFQGCAWLCVQNIVPGISDIRHLEHNTMKDFLLFLIRGWEGTSLLPFISEQGLVSDS